MQLCLLPQCNPLPSLCLSPLCLGPVSPGSMVVWHLIRVCVCVGCVDKIVGMTRWLVPSELAGWLIGTPSPQPHPLLYLVLSGLTGPCLFVWVCRQEGLWHHAHQRADGGTGQGGARGGDATWVQGTVRQSHTAGLLTKERKALQHCLGSRLMCDWVCYVCTASCM